MQNNSIATLLYLAKKRLSASSTPQLDAELLLMHVLGVSRAILMAWPLRQVDESELKAFEELLVRRELGEPVAYIIGHQSFWDVELRVTKAVLIPRPETELIVEWVLSKFEKQDDIKLADLGTGAGAIALAIAKHKPHWTIHATDNSQEALKIAKQNATFNEIKNVTFYEGSWCEALPQKNYDIIVSNPPYIAPGDPHLLIGDVRFEPSSALVSNHYGFDDLFKIAEQAKNYLNPNGFLVLEHGFEQADKLREHLKQLGYESVEAKKDLAGHARMTVACYKES